MNSEKIPAVIEIIRPFNVAIIMIVIAAAVVLSGGIEIGILTVILASLAGGLIGGGANVINDYFDIAIDRVNKPNRPLARGALTPQSAFLLWLVCTVAGISLNLFLNSESFWIAVSAAAGLFLYSALLKGTVLLGNFVVAGMTGLALIYGGVVAGSAEQAYVPAAFAFLINFGREIVKDVEDLEGDRQGNARTFPVVFGVSRALSVATMVFVILMGATFVPYTLGMYGERYLLLVAVVDVLICFVIISMWSDKTSPNLARLNNLLKVSMLIGLGALYAA